MSAESFKHFDMLLERLRVRADGVLVSPCAANSGDDEVRELLPTAERALFEIMEGWPSALLSVVFRLIHEDRFVEASRRVGADECQQIVSFLSERFVAAVVAHSSPDLRIRLELLSGRAFARGIPIEIPPRELAVLTYLAIYGRPLNREAITDAIWPGHDPVVAAKNLKVIVHRARKRLGESVIESSRERYTLGSSVFVDLPYAESLLQAAKAESSRPDGYGRRLRALVQSCRARDAAALSRYDWYVAFESRLREIERDASLQLCRRANEAGDYGATLAIASDLLALDATDDLACELSIAARLALPDIAGARRDLRAFAVAARAEGDEIALERMEKTFSRMLNQLGGPMVGVAQ